MNIWPSRTIALVRPHSMGREGTTLLPLADLEPIIKAAERFGASIDRPILLGDFRQSVALIPIGLDGVGNGGVLLVHVTNVVKQRDPLLCLEVVSSGTNRPSDRPRLLPSQASEMLDKMVEQIKKASSHLIASGRER